MSMSPKCVSSQNESHTIVRHTLNVQVSKLCLSFLLAWWSRHPMYERALDWQTNTILQTCILAQSPVTQLHGCPNCVSYSSLSGGLATLCTKELRTGELQKSGMHFSRRYLRRALWHSVMSHEFMSVVTYHSRRSSRLTNCDYLDSACNIWEFWYKCT